MTQRKRFDARLNVYVTAELQRKLEQIRDQRGPQTTVPDIVRDAVRQYIDNEEEIIGSRRHFQRNLREALDEATFELLWNNLILLAFIWQRTNPMVNPTTQKALTFKETYDNSVQFTKQNWASVMRIMKASIQTALREAAKQEAK